MEKDRIFERISERILERNAGNNFINTELGNN